MAEEGKGEKKVRYGPGRRPIVNYQGAQGWQERIYIPTLAAVGGMAYAVMTIVTRFDQNLARFGPAQAFQTGVVGGGVGILSGILKGHSISKLSLPYAVNSAIVTSCFCGARELVRELRVAEPEDPINSFLGGIASGGFLGRLQGGRPRAIQYAILFAAVGTTLQFGTLKFQEYCSEQNKKSHSTDTSGEVESSPSEKKRWTWPEWLPIQRLDEEAAAKRTQERDLQIQRTLEKLKKGDSL